MPKRNCIQDVEENSHPLRKTDLFVFFAVEAAGKTKGFLLPTSRHQRRKRLDTTPYQVNVEKIHIGTGTPTVDPIVTVGFWRRMSFCALGSTK